MIRIQPWSSLNSDSPQLDPELISRSEAALERVCSPVGAKADAAPTVQIGFEHSEAANKIRQAVQHMNPVSFLSPSSTRAPLGLTSHPALHRLFRAYVLAYELELPPSDLARFVQSSQLVPELYSSVAELAAVLDNMLTADQHALVDFMEFTVWLIDGVQHDHGLPAGSPQIVQLPLSPHSQLFRGTHCRWLGGLRLMQSVLGQHQNLRLLVTRWSRRVMRYFREMYAFKQSVHHWWDMWIRETLWRAWNRWEAAMGQFREVRLIVEMEQSRRVWEKKIEDVEDHLATLLVNECNFGS